ncbi:hypothetical protein ACS4RR_005965 [Rhizobium sp. Z1P35]
MPDIAVCRTIAHGSLGGFAADHKPVFDGSVGATLGVIGAILRKRSRGSLEIQEIRRELRFAGDNVTQELFSTLSHRYDAVLQKYSINHDDVDFYRYQLQYPKEYIMNRFDRFEKSAKVFMAYSYPAMILLLLTGAVFLFTLFLIVWGGDAGRFLEWAALRFS